VGSESKAIAVSTLKIGPVSRKILTLEGLQKQFVVHLVHLDALGRTIIVLVPLFWRHFGEKDPGIRTLFSLSLCLYSARAGTHEQAGPRRSFERQTRESHALLQHCPYTAHAIVLIYIYVLYTFDENVRKTSITREESRAAAYTPKWSKKRRKKLKIYIVRTISNFWLHINEKF